MATFMGGFSDSVIFILQLKEKKQNRSEIPFILLDKTIIDNI